MCLAPRAHLVAGLFLVLVGTTMHLVLQIIGLSAPRENETTTLSALDCLSTAVQLSGVFSAVLSVVPCTVSMTGKKGMTETLRKVQDP